MTAGELLEAAHSFPFHPLRKKLEECRAPSRR